MKRIVSSCIGLVLLFGILVGSPIQTNANSPGRYEGNWQEEGDWSYGIWNGEAIVLRYNGAGGDVTVPQMLGGAPVVFLGNELPPEMGPGMISGGGVFFNCDTVTSVTIPDGVTIIRGQTFYGCTSLKKVVIPDSVTTIERRAFSLCRSLKDVSIPNGVTTIGSDAFYGAPLPDVVIPPSVTSIGTQAFSTAASITVDPANPAYTSIDGVLFSKDKTQLITYPKGKTAASYTVPDGVKEIRSFGFYNPSLTSIILPDSVTTIDVSAFYGCNSLKSITIPDGVKDIDHFAFCADELGIYYIYPYEYHPDLMLDVTIKCNPNSYAHQYAVSHEFQYELLSGTATTPTTSKPTTPTTSRPSTPSTNRPDTPVTSKPTTSSTNRPGTPTTSKPDTPEPGNPTVSVPTGTESTTGDNPGQIPAPDSSASESSPTGQVTFPDMEEQPVILTDEDSGIKIGAENGVVPDDTVLVVEPSNIILQDAEGKFAAFDISLESGNVKIQPSGKVLVSIPIPSGYDRERLTIYHIATDGTQTELPSAVDGNMITFETDHFSTYVVAEKAVPVNTTPVDKSGGNQAYIWIILSAVLVVLLIGTGVVVWFFKFRKKPSEN